jgi:hypothetical protein
MTAVRPCSLKIEPSCFCMYVYILYNVYILLVLFSRVISAQWDKHSPSMLKFPRSIPGSVKSTSRNIKQRLKNICSNCWKESRKLNPCSSPLLYHNDLMKWNVHGQLFTSLWYLTNEIQNRNSENQLVWKKKRQSKYLVVRVLVTRTGLYKGFGGLDYLKFVQSNSNIWNLCNCMLMDSCSMPGLLFDQHVWWATIFHWRWNTHW